MVTSIEWVRVKDLIPHEDIIPFIVEQNIVNIKKRRKVIPIIVDDETNLILDGHHRYYAFLKLGINKIPVYYVKYKSNQIIVNSWYRLVCPSIHISFNTEGKFCVSYHDRKILCENSLYRLYWKQHFFEQQLTRLGFKIIKTRIKDFIFLHYLRII